LVLNLSTGCVSPQYHCRFDNFFETTRHNGPDVNGTTSWQLLAGLNRAEMILSKVSAPTQHSIMYPETQSEAINPSEEMSVTPPFHEFMTDDHSFSDGDSQITENVRPSRQSRASHGNEGVTSAQPTVTAGTSHEAVGSSSTQDAPSPGLLNFSHKLPYLLLKPSTLLCHNLYVTSFLL